MPKRDPDGVISPTHVKQLIAHRVREAREERGMSQVELSRRAEMSNSTILRWENEENLPPIDKLLRVADVLDRDLAYFLQDLSESIRYSLSIDDRWLPVAEGDDPHEAAIRLRDLVEDAPEVEIYVGISHPPA